MKMELELVRTYFPNGTNGEFLLSNKRVCSSIELAWLDNKHGVSCIPEGRYELVKRYSEKFGWHLLLKDVPDRSLILIHPANDAVKELRGCIAPVSVLTAEGKGLRSRIASKKVIALAITAFEQSKQVFLTIKS
jgi:hypothetical protein